MAMQSKGRWWERDSAAGLALVISALVSFLLVNGPAASSFEAILRTSLFGIELGEIVTLSLQAKGVRITPDQASVSENAPSHRIYVGRAEIGAAWPKRSQDGRAYLSVKLDDPSLNAPIFANLFDEDDDIYALVWSRSRKSNGD